MHGSGALHQFNNERAPLPQLALVDLKGVSVSATRKLSFVPFAIALDQHFAYAAVAGADVIHVFSRKDLGDVKRVFPNGRVLLMVPVAGKFLFVSTENQRQVVLKLPELRPARADEVGAGIHLSAPGESRSPEAPVALGDRWWYDGCLYDAEFTKPIVFRPSGFWTNPGVPPVPPDPTIPREFVNNREIIKPPVPQIPQWIGPWGIQLDFRGFRHGRRVVQMPFNHGIDFPSVIKAVMPGRPALAFLEFEQDSGGFAKKLSIQFRELLAGTVQFELPLSSDQTMVFQAARHLALRPGTLVATHERQLYVLPTPELDPAKFPIPLHVAPGEPGALVLDKPATLPAPRFAGGKAPVEVTLRTELRGVEFNSKSLRLDHKLLLEEATKTALAALSIPRDFAGRRLTAEEALAEYVRETADSYARLTGRKPTGVPVWLSIGLFARDADLQTIEAEQGMFIELPLDELRPKAKALRVESPTEPLVPLDPDRPPTAEELTRAVQRLNGKVERLERQMNELQETIKRLNQLLEKKENGR